MDKNNIINVSAEILKRKEKLKLSYKIAITSAIEAKDDNLIDMVIEVLIQSVLFDLEEFIDYTYEIFKTKEITNNIIKKLREFANE
jgi:hypothetical protein